MAQRTSTLAKPATPTTNGRRSPTAAETVQPVPPGGTVLINLPELELRQVSIRIRGTSPLITHPWSQKAREQMLAKQTKTASKGRLAKDPEQEYQDSIYHHPEGGYGFPSVGVKAAMVRAGTYADLKMTFLRGCFHLAGEWVRIEGEPRKREDMVRVGMGVADIRFRAEFPEWEATLDITFNARAISLEQLTNLVNVAGFAVGIGEWRPERDGQFGRFTVL